MSLEAAKPTAHRHRRQPNSHHGGLKAAHQGRPDSYRYVWERFLVSTFPAKSTRNLLAKSAKKATQ
jgi:hypothetical protein